jgi:hypothetical protein
MDDIMELMYLAEPLAVLRLNEVSPSSSSDIAKTGHTDDGKNIIGIAVRTTTQQDEAIRDYYPLFPRASLSSSTPRVVQAPRLRF